MRDAAKYNLASSERILQRISYRVLHCGSSANAFNFTMSLKTAPCRNSSHRCGAVVLVTCLLMYVMGYFTLDFSVKPVSQLTRHWNSVLTKLWKESPLEAVNSSESSETRGVSEAQTPSSNVTFPISHHANVSGDKSNFPPGYSNVTLESFRGDSLSSLMIGSLKPGCKTPYFDLIRGPHAVQEGSGLPPDLSYMAYETCRDEQPPSPKRKLIVNLNRQEWWYSNDPHYTTVFQGCPYNACDFTDDRSLLSKADALFVTVCRLNMAEPPPRVSPKQIWIAFAMESPVHYYGHHNSPHWKGVFNWTMTYRLDSDVFTPYSALSLRPAPTGKNYTSITGNKTRPAAWFVSNCNAPSQRHAYVKQLQQYIDVDIYGACSGKRYKGDWKGLLSTTYYFYLSFENSFCRDYVTEKLFKIYENVDVIPIVRGAADYHRYFPPGTFLDTADYPTPKHLAAHLKSLMTDPRNYTRMLQAKDRFISGIYYNSVCEVCKRLHTLGESKVYPDFMKWTKDNVCRGPSDV